MQADTLDTLFSARDVVSDMIIAQTPSDAAHKKLLEKLMQRRDQLTAAIQQVINARFTKTSAELTQSITNLENTTGQLKDLGSTLASVSSAINLVDQIVQMVGAIVTLAA